MGFFDRLFDRLFGKRDTSSTRDGNRMPAPRPEPRDEDLKSDEELTSTEVLPALTPEELDRLERRAAELDEKYTLARRAYDVDPTPERKRVVAQLRSEKRFIALRILGAFDDD